MTGADPLAATSRLAGAGGSSGTRAAPKAGGDILPGGNLLPGADILQTVTGGLLGGAGGRPAAPAPAGDSAEDPAKAPAEDTAKEETEDSDGAKVTEAVQQAATATGAGQGTGGLPAGLSPGSNSLPLGLLGG